MRKKYVLAKRFMELCRIFPIQKKAVFQSFFGKYYNCSPRAIYEAMRRQMPDCKYIWLMNDDSTPIEGAKVVRRDSWSALYHLATAALWVDNMRKPVWTAKRKGEQFYVQTCHAASTALKKVEADAEDRLNRGYVASAKHDSSCIDLILSASKWRSNLIRRAYWYDGEILECGLPRSDVFFRDGSQIKEKVYDYYGLPSETKLAVYAPTFRNGDNLTVYLSVAECEYVLKSLEKRFGGEWKLIVRLHPNIAEQQGDLAYNDRVLNGSAYSEMNDLIVAGELLITDYSSCMFDAMEAGKKVMLYASDVEDYMDERGYYYSLDELPFPVAESAEALGACIEGFDEALYARRSGQFMETIGSFNNAHASERVSECVIERMKALGILGRKMKKQ